MKVLLVDDSQVSRSLLKKSFDHLDMEVEFDFATDGKEAYNLLFANEGEYRMAIMDINMPEMNGDECISQCAKDGISLPYVIISSTENERGKILELLSLGVRDYLIKPFAMEDLKEKVARAMEQTSED